MPRLDPKIADRFASSAMVSLWPSPGEKAICTRRELKEAFLAVAQEAYEVGFLARQEIRLYESVRPGSTDRRSWMDILVTRAAEKMTDEQRQLLDRIKAQCPDVIPLRQLALGFRSALTSGESIQTRRWIEGAKRCAFGSVVRFAYGLQKDISAVNAAVDTSWSNGQVEGQVNRLKTIKRQMYGRAGFELLRARVLPYSPAVSAGPAP